MRCQWFDYLSILAKLFTNLKLTTLEKFHRKVLMLCIGISLPFEHIAPKN